MCSPFLRDSCGFGTRYSKKGLQLTHLFSTIEKPCTLRLRYDQNASEVQPLDQGLAVQREYLAVDPVTLTSTGQLG